MSLKNDLPQLDPLRIVDAQFHAAATEAGQLPPALGVEIAFVGRSNVGKSSLMNALCGRRNLVRTSSTPGCTRQIAFFKVRTADGAQLTLVDLPGYGFAKRSKGERKQWAQLIEGYLLTRPTLSTIAALVDLRRGIEPDDAELLEMLAAPALVKRAALSVISVGTKLDKIAASQRQAATAALKRQTTLPTASVSVELPDTCRRLWRTLRAHTGLEQLVPEAGKEADDA